MDVSSCETQLDTGFTAAANPNGLNNVAFRAPAIFAVRVATVEVPSEWLIKAATRARRASELEGVAVALVCGPFAWRIVRAAGGVRAVVRPAAASP